MKDSNFIGLDSNIFIYSFEEHPQFSLSTKKIFEGLERKHFAAVTSIISLTETLSFPMSQERASLLIDLFLQVPQLTVYEVNNSIAMEAARIRREYKFRLPDAIQFATCLYAKANTFVTNDKRLQSFKEIRVTLLNEIKITD